MNIDRIIIIRDKTRLEHLVERFNSKAQAKFYLESNNENFQSIEQENDVFYESLKTIEEQISKRFKFKVLFREFLSTYIFSKDELVVVIGQDGLVVNTAKYINNQLIVAVNPNTTRYDGVLLPFKPNQISTVLERVETDIFKTKTITMAEAVFNDGQRLLAFNDFFIGAATHVSARYSISYGKTTENQSSSGILVSTGVGFSGWMSSVFNMARNISKSQDLEECNYPKTDWSSQKLLFAVREPFLSKATQVSIGYGEITASSTLKIKSQMATNGVVFSDGIESDFISFNTGNSVEIGVAKEKTLLVVE